jgi:transcriptional regulator with XRE-family HTH domain
MPLANRKAARESMPPSPQALYRGLYVRIARKLGVDPSYVSRVARGERSSSAIEGLLQRELDAIARKLGKMPLSHAVKLVPHKGQGPRVQPLVKGEMRSICRDWLRHCLGDPNLRAYKLPVRQRMAPIPALLVEAIRLSKVAPKDIAAMPRRAAEKHGGLRRTQGYSTAALVEEYNVLRRCIFRVAEKHFHRVNDRRLLHDLAQVGEALHLQLRTALNRFLD